MGQKVAPIDCVKRALYSLCYEHRHTSMYPTIPATPEEGANR